MPSLLALRSRWRLNATSVSSAHTVSFKIAVDYGHSTVSGNPPPILLPPGSTTEPTEANVVRSKDGCNIELNFKNMPNVDLHLLVDSANHGNTQKENIFLSSRSLSPVVGGDEEDDKGAIVDSDMKLRACVRKLIRAHECQFNEELFKKVNARRYDIFVYRILLFGSCSHSILACCGIGAQRRKKGVPC